MGLALYFDPAKFPRTITRAEWKEIWRWKRITQKKLAEELNKQMNNFILFGSTWPDHIRDDFIYQTTNPPLLVHDKQELG